ncbi:phosphoesterase [Streptomyces alfalfae]|uniref:Phosphoesterase n=1 Tax=Streptomyces alfalfae TaxID=1642299 RepID=A0ABN4VFF9_9ACTN|nr:metallophosphoesterase family protein [Streptomyces alfalfae]APY86201.1 phosphoesterase [Streptomyces alfalfae]AYA16581.1 metallophosphoesterase family protein [Streptomyces fradiae]RXX48294.1 phosphoesterase [Streptomyces alfalfae]RZM91037.1 metallophosphoesterase family protein [Streptomyces alfalfae]
MDTPNVGIPERLAAGMSMPEQHAYLRGRLSRRRVLAGSFAAAGTAAGAALLAGSSGSAHGRTGTRTSAVAPSSRARVDGRLVAPFGRHLAFGADPRTQMRISWQVPLAVRSPFVRIGTRPWELSQKIAAEVRDLRTPSLSKKLPAVEQYYVHAALDGLRPDTTYYYGVGHDGFDPASPERMATLGTFRTAPAKAGRFVFTAFGDQGVSYHALANDQLILGQDPAFHLHAGDICYADDTGHGKESDTYDARVWDTFLAQTESVAKSVPWMVTTGNHDMEAWYSPNGYGGQAARWSLPDNGFDPAKAPGVYSFRYGNVGVVALDANDVSYEIPVNRGYTDGRQTAWLDRRLGDLRADAGTDFIVVFFHHCAYSTSRHASDGGVRDAWLKLFAKHQVDLVINGHNHVYERTDAIKDGEVGKPVPVGASTDPTRDGIVYVTAGGAGKDLYGFGPGVEDSYEGHVHERDHVETFRWTKRRRSEPETVEWSRVRYTGYSFLAVEVTAGTRPRMTVSALAESGERVDHFEVVRGAR